MPRLHHLDPRLPPPPRPRRRDPRRDADDRAQPLLLPTPDGRPPRRDRGGAAEGLRGRLPRPLPGWQLAGDLKPSPPLKPSPVRGRVGWGRSVPVTTLERRTPSPNPLPPGEKAF